MCQQRMDDSYLDFALADAERFSKLQIVFAALKDAKTADTIDPVAIAKTFASTNEQRKLHFGKFK